MVRLAICVFVRRETSAANVSSAVFRSSKEEGGECENASLPTPDLLPIMGTS